VKDSPPAFMADEDGAMMLIALFMALFMIGALYFLMGIGDAIFYRRLMQDSADAGAYGAAVTAARGMNLHVLLNLIMMVTTGILLIIRTIERLLELAFAATLAANIGCLGCLSGEVATLKTAEVTTSRIGDGVERFVSEAHRALDQAHAALQRGFPALALFRASRASTESAYKPPVSQGFALPLEDGASSEGLPGFPLEEGSVGTHCDRFAAELGDGIAGALSSVGGAVAELTGRGLGAMASVGLKLGKPKTCKDDILKPPRRVLGERQDGSVLWLGQEEFQYRAFAIGESPSKEYWERGARGVAIAQGGRQKGWSTSARLADLGQLSFAQAEYFFDGTEKKSHWMWRMKWRGRLRRFRMPSKLTSVLGRACPGSAELCGALVDLTGSMESVH
jgi:hypothetical protein